MFTQHHVDCVVANFHDLAALNTQSVGRVAHGVVQLVFTVEVQLFINRIDFAFFCFQNDEGVDMSAHHWDFSEGFFYIIHVDTHQIGDHLSIQSLACAVVITVSFFNCGNDFVQRNIFLYVFFHRSVGRTFLRRRFIRASGEGSCTHHSSQHES